MLAALSSIHPAVSGFSLAFLLLLGWLDGRAFIVSRTLAPEGRAPLWALGIALTAAFFSGYLSSGFLYPSPDPVISSKIGEHHVIGRWALIVFPIVALARHLASRRGDTVSAVLYAVMWMMLGVLLICGGKLGGTLVFEFGVGVLRAA